jgi:hypothetical protein
MQNENFLSTKRGKIIASSIAGAVVLITGIFILAWWKGLIFPYKMKKKDIDSFVDKCKITAFDSSTATAEPVKKFITDLDKTLTDLISKVEKHNEGHKKESQNPIKTETLDKIKSFSADVKTVKSTTDGYTSSTSQPDVKTLLEGSNYKKLTQSRIDDIFTSLKSDLKLS